MLRNNAINQFDGVTLNWETVNGKVIYKFTRTSLGRKGSLIFNDEGTLMENNGFDDIDVKYYSKIISNIIDTHKILYSKGD